ncbi:MAG: PIG-L family deacetylase [Gemmatimonadota bacterium]|nr:PIG-L family deacetylase [Gemmatimonadota bacterium]
MNSRIVALAFLLTAPRLLSSQERGAIVLGEAVAGLDVTARVLVIGAHPDDEDTQLITWLARGRQVETGYLSLTRGDGGQNLIGNELGVQLGMIRTEELLAARRLDGGRQFFTRAYDFGFSKTADETYKHWPKDSLLRDVVTVIRAFRPQVIVAVFSGTPRDGHGHHQVSAMLAREAFDAAMDTVRFPSRNTLGLGAWTPLKFYRASRFTPAEATVTFNVGELSPLRGQTYAEISSQSRSQHLSQGFGSLQRRGTLLDYLKLEVSRVSEPLKKETSPLQDIAADWSRFGSASLPEGIAAPVRAALDSVPGAIASVRAAERLTAPAPMVAPLARLTQLLATVRDALPCERRTVDAGCRGTVGDLAISLETAEARAHAALLAAAGVLVEATSPRELIAVGDTVPVTVSVYNQGRVDVTLDMANAWSGAGSFQRIWRGTRALPPDSSAQVTVLMSPTAPTIPWWLAQGRLGDVFIPPPGGKPAAENIGLGEDRVADSYAVVNLHIAGVPVVVDAGPVVYRYADPARGEQRRPVAAVPKISVLLDDEVEYARAGVPFERSYTVHLHNATSAARGVSVTLSTPAQLKVDSTTRRVAMEPYSDAVVVFHVKGALPVGRHVVSVTAQSGDETFASGYVPIRYEHIRPLRSYREARVEVEAVEAKLPANTTIAYIRGVGDNVATMLAELGMKVTMLTPKELASADLSKFGAVVVGPRAFAASPVLVAQRARLTEFARKGGTVVLQYGQNEIETPGILPYPVSLRHPTAERVTEENAPVTLIGATSSVMSQPNRITSADFANWVQERSTYMPTTADPHYQHVFEMHDPGEAANENAVLIAPVGKGAYVYNTLALFRQLPAGVPGAARIFLNLIAADGKAPASPLPRP